MGFAVVSPNILNTTSNSGAQHKRFYSLASLVSARPKWQGPLSENNPHIGALQVPSFYVQICKCLSCSLLGNHCISQVWVNCFVSVFSFITSADSRLEGLLHCSLPISRLTSEKLFSLPHTPTHSSVKTLHGLVLPKVNQKKTLASHHGSLTYKIYYLN